jgi:hypothetical protein
MEELRNKVVRLSSGRRYNSMPKKPRVQIPICRLKGLKTGRIHEAILRERVNFHGFKNC